MKNLSKSHNLVVDCLVFAVFLMLVGLHLPHGGGNGRLRSAFAGESVGLPAASPVDLLWERGLDQQQRGNHQQAFRIFRDFYKKYPEDERASEALWMTAVLSKKAALAGDGARWEETRILFRDFAIGYPDSPRAPEAYLEVANALANLHLHREALGYTNILLDKYPESEVLVEALKNKALLLVRLGRPAEAEKFCLSYLAGNRPELDELKLILAEIYLSSGRNSAALKVVKDIRDDYPEHSPQRLEAMRVEGLVLLRQGSDADRDRARELLFYYLNVSGGSARSAEIGTLLAESFLTENLFGTAAVLYQRVLEGGGPNEQTALLSRFRLVWLREFKGVQNPFLGGSGLGDDEIDRIYLDFIESFHDDPRSQEARFALMKRYVSRADWERAYLIGSAYLSRGGKQTEDVIADLGLILIKRMEGLLKDGDWQAVYDLYRQEYPVVKKYSRGRLLFLTGQALEALSLYDKAATIYYRALALPMSDAEKTDLYLRRARLYLKMDDRAAAGRLLRYLRRMYAGRDSMGDILLLSGKLSEKTSRVEEAGTYYRAALESALDSRGKGEAVGRLFQLLLGGDKIAEAGKLLADSLENKWLTAGPDLQEMFDDLGYAAGRDGRDRLARTAYESALAEGFPQEGELAQKIHIYLGDVYSRLELPDQAMAQYQIARSGKDSRWAEVAKGRIMQVGIDNSLKKLYNDAASQ